MTYQPFLISNFATGFDRERQPWLLPTDAQDQLLDGFVYRGVWEKREGYTQFANGQRGGFPLTESRMVHTVTLTPTSGAIDGANHTYTFTLPVPPPSEPIRRGGVRAIGSNPIQLIQDNGIGGTRSGSNGTIGTTITYVLPAPLTITVTFTTAPTMGSSVTMQVDLHQGLPVMGVMNFYNEDELTQLIVADTTYVNRYEPTTNTLQDISPTVLLTGTNINFMSWANYDDSSGDPRLLFVNNKDPIQQYDGTSVTPFPAFTEAGPPVTTGSPAAYNTGNGTAGPYAWLTPVPVVPGTVTIVTGAQTVTDDGFGNLKGAGSGTIIYSTGVTSVTFNAALGMGDAITIAYTPMTTAIDTCLHLFQFQDRLVLLYPTINSKRFGKTILISGTGIYGDVFFQSFTNPSGTEVSVTGSGAITISDDSFLNSADFNRDDLIFFTQLCTWILKFTGNDAEPFDVSKIDSSRGTLAPYGTISYLNLTTGESPRGFIGCDGYSVQRTDNKIPRYSYDDINLDHFNLCFAGTVDEDRDHYLIHPSPSAVKSDRILISNYEEFNYSIYRIALSCMGNFFSTVDITWADLAIFNSWEEMAVQYSTWDAFSYQSDTPIGIGGGHRGEIVELNVTQSQDYPVAIRGISGNSFALAVTTDFNQYAVGDYIYLSGMLGSVEINNKQGFITAVADSYNFTLQLDNDPAIVPSAYTANTGLAAKVIEFDCLTKRLNPFCETDNKVRCGWCYFYVSTTGTLLTDEEGAPVEAELKVRVLVNDTDTPTTLSAPNINYYTINLSSHDAGNGVKKWCKIWINQTARFVQFQVFNNQAGAKVQIQAIMPGFAPVGRLV